MSRSKPFTMQFRICKIYVANELTVLSIDIDECEPSNDCMQKCINSIGSYNCSCDEFFERDPTDWRNCAGEFDICLNIFHRFLK